MTNLIFLIVGLLLGGFVGVAFMCCLQINRLHKYDQDERRASDEEKKCE